MIFNDELEQIIARHKNISASKLSKYLKKSNYIIPPSTLGRYLKLSRDIETLKKSYIRTRNQATQKEIENTIIQKDKKLKSFYVKNTKHKFVRDFLLDPKYGIAYYDKMSFLLGYSADQNNEKSNKALSDLIKDYFKIETKRYVELLKNKTTVKARRYAVEYIVLSQETKKKMVLPKEDEYCFVSYHIQIDEKGEYFKFKKFFKIVSTRNWGEAFSNLLKAPDSYGAFNGILDKIKVKDKKLHNTLIRNALKAISSLEAENK